MFCKLGGFLNKFSLRERIQIPNHFVCAKKKNSNNFLWISEISCTQFKCISWVIWCKIILFMKHWWMKSIYSCVSNSRRDYLNSMQCMRTRLRYIFCMNIGWARVCTKLCNKDIDSTIFKWLKLYIKSRKLLNFWLTTIYTMDVYYPVILWFYPLRKWSAPSNCNNTLIWNVWLLIWRTGRLTKTIGRGWYVSYPKHGFPRNL